MSSEPDIHGTSVVLLGDFNPKIFQPSWFGAQGLIRPTEAETAEVKIIHPDVVEFSLEWVQVQVTRERFSADTRQDAFFEVLRDLVLGTFDLLSHTPVRRMGINVQMHFRMPSEDAWHSFGHKIAPKDLWTELLDNPGLANLTMQGGRPDEYDGHIQVQVQPSRQLSPHGIHLAVNDDYMLKGKDSTTGSKGMMEVLQNSWVQSLERSRSIINTLMER
ncbi:MAG: hypothetical protein GKR94_32480 [Gammaproteobacteria bacterium]|nr:hypothetical protein [Gammaproteobacteria bacterium]